MAAWDAGAAALRFGVPAVDAPCADPLLACCVSAGAGAGVLPLLPCVPGADPGGAEVPVLRFEVAFVVAADCVPLLAEFDVPVGALLFCVPGGVGVLLSCWVLAFPVPDEFAAPAWPCGAVDPFVLGVAPLFWDDAVPEPVPDAALEPESDLVPDAVPEPESDCVPEPESDCVPDAVPDPESDCVFCCEAVLPESS